MSSKIEKINYSIIEGLDNSDIGEYYFYNNLLEFPEIIQMYEEYEKRVIAVKSNSLKGQSTGKPIYDIPVRYSATSTKPVVIY